MKKLNRIIFFVIVMSICLISILSNKVYAVENTINEIKIEVNIKEDGIAEITETWNVEMYGISELYKPYYGLNISQIENFTVIDETNNRYEYVPDWDIDATREEKANKCGIYVNKEQGETDICWGVQKDGKHTYILKYNITNFIKQNMGYQTVNFKFLQSNMDPLPKKISVIVESENQFKEKEVIATGYGYEGEAKIENGKAIFKAEEGLGTDDYMTIELEFNENAFSVSDEDKTLDAYQNDGILAKSHVSKYTIYAVIVFILIIVILVVDMYRKKKKVK